MKTGKHTIQVKRVYEPASPKDGYRVLVDRLWPRGMTKEKAGIDYWFKEIAPSDALRKKFHNKPTQWNDFQHAYLKELRGNDAVTQLQSLIQEHTHITLLYASRDEEHNNAVVLRDYLVKPG